MNRQHDAASERRAELRALASNPDYDPRPTWRCSICSEQNPPALTRCDTCGGQGPTWLPEGTPAQLERPRTPVIVKVAHRGQALVELALVLPVALFTGLGFLEAGFLVAQKAHQDRDTAVVAAYAAEHRSEDWHAVLPRLGLTGCDVDVTEDHDVATATSTCAYTGRVTTGILDVDISSEESASIAGQPTPPATPAPTAGG